jgi:hypothetical protein
MIITLTSDADVFTFVQYLIHKNMLAQYFETITIKDEDSDDYLRYLTNLRSEAPIRVGTSAPCVSTKDASYKPWTDTERETLQQSINLNKTPTEIAKQFGRTVNAIRSYAINYLNTGYRNDTWVPLNRPAGDTNGS